MVNLSDMSIQKSPFGNMPDGVQIDLYTITNKSGLSVRIMSYGLTITELHVPDARGQSGNVVLGFDNLQRYLSGSPYFGATVGRFANRIAGGRFTLDGKQYQLPINNAPNSLHGGAKALTSAPGKSRHPRTMPFEALMSVPMARKVIPVTSPRS